MNELDEIQGRLMIIKLEIKALSRLLRSYQKRNGQIGDRNLGDSSHIGPSRTTHKTQKSQFKE